MKVRGFKASAVKAGIKHPDRLDLGLIVSDFPVVAAGVFTSNEVKAAPVIAGIKRLKNGKPFLKALIVNSGNANACTGKHGLMDVMELCDLVSRKIDCRPDEVLMSSTGVIGRPLPVQKIKDALPSLVQGLREDGLDDVAAAILTTDLVKKTALREVEFGNSLTTILGIAKGSGMIAPGMISPQATMLAFIMTDASIHSDFARQILQKTTDSAFNAITVDGCMSTNDTVLLLASGLAGNETINGGDNGKIFEEALHEVMSSLASQIVKDGEGATKLVTVKVKGARRREDARIIARAIADSLLVKTAFFGEDPNWGRILSAAGQAGFPLIQGLLSVFINNIPIVRMGEGLGDEAEADAKKVMEGSEFTVTLDLGLGEFEAKVLTCDLTCDYVKINADYRT
jgi:glutamate N-acetyltransferase/amino-acid N-acetyltransferase